MSNHALIDFIEQEDQRDTYPAMVNAIPISR